MSPEVLRKCLEAEPFIPLSISVADHSGYSIESREQVELTDDGSALVIAQRGERILVSVAHIVSVSFESASGKSFGFGPRGEILR
jgi:hypothetical protein